MTQRRGLGPVGVTQGATRRGFWGALVLLAVSGARGDGVCAGPDGNATRGGGGWEQTEGRAGRARGGGAQTEAERVTAGLSRRQARSGRGWARQGWTRRRR